MRIAIVAGPYIPVPPHKYGGTERGIYYLIKGLKEKGHEPILLGPGDSKPGCKLVPIVDRGIYFPRTLAGLAEFQKNLQKIQNNTVKKIQEILPSVDIIHSHDIDIHQFEDFPNLTTIHGPIVIKQLDYYTKRKGLFFASISKNQQEAYPD